MWVNPSAFETSNSVSVISPSNQVIATITVGIGVDPFAVAVSPSGDVYVANQGGGTVSVISPGGAVIATIGVGASPAGVAVAP